MHIPDGFLTAGVTGITWAGAGLGVAAALRAEKADPNPMPAGILGATAAFVFAAQMINIRWRLASAVTWSERRSRPCCWGRGAPSS